MFTVFSLGERRIDLLSADTVTEAVLRSQRLSGVSVALIDLFKPSKKSFTTFIES